MKMDLVLKADYMASLTPDLTAMDCFLWGSLKEQFLPGLSKIV
jgi:hypothetical protein